MYGIMLYFQDYPKAVRRGEISMKSNHVQRISYDPDLGRIMGVVKSSQRKETYSIEVSLHTNPCVHVFRILRRNMNDGACKYADKI